MTHNRCLLCLSMLPKVTRLFWTTRPSDGSWSHRPAPLPPWTRALRPPPWASQSQNPSRSREMKPKKMAYPEKTVAGRRAGLDATRAEWVDWADFVLSFFWQRYKLHFDIVGHVWCAVVSRGWAHSDVSHLWSRGLQTLCQEDNRSGKCVQVCNSIDVIELI